MLQIDIQQVSFIIVISQQSPFVKRSTKRAIIVNLFQREVKLWNRVKHHTSLFNEGQSDEVLFALG